jgi:hypothetical protein
MPRTYFKTIGDIFQWVDHQTSNWDGRTDEQVAELVAIIRNNITYHEDASKYLATLPDNLADLLDDK